MTTTYAQLGQQIGELTDQKNAAYGSSFAKAGEYLRLLYPDGVRPEQYTDLLLLARDFDKSMRIATDQDAFGESPYGDKAGYALLGAKIHDERKKRCGIASGAADDVSKEQGSSAAPNANNRTTTSDVDRSEPSSKPPSSSNSRRSSDSTADASAHSATGDASSGEDARPRSKHRTILAILYRCYPDAVAWHAIRTELFSLGLFERDITITMVWLQHMVYITHRADVGYFITDAGIDYLLRFGVYES